MVVLSPRVKDLLEVDATIGSVIGVPEIEERVRKLLVESIAREGGVERRTADANNHHQKKRNGLPGGGPRRRALASAPA